MSGPTDDGAKPEKERKLPHLTQVDLESFVDEFGRTHYSMKDGRQVCGRLKKEKNRKIPDEACLGVPMASGPCKVHGGKAGRPLSHGRYSRVTKTWHAAFERALADEELLDAKRDLALMDVVTELLIERAEELDSPSWREELRDTFGQLQRAIRSQRQEVVGPLLKLLGELIERGATADQVARDLVAQVDRRAARACKIDELGLRRQEKITATELAAVFKQFLDVLERELEPAMYHQVLPELRRVTGPGQLERGA